MTSTIGAGAQNVNTQSPKKNSEQNVSHKSFIEVTDEGVFMSNGRAFDLLGLVFQVQRQTGKLAQERLAFVAKELWDTNRRAKMVVSFLNGLRSVRPDGGADSKADAHDLTEQIWKFEKTYGDDPFDKIGLEDMRPDPLYVFYKYDRKKKEWVKDSDLSQKQMEGRYYFHPNDIKTLENLGLEERKDWLHGTQASKEYDYIKQAELDQIIEGVKSQLSAINSKQQLMQTAIERYTRMSDETKEQMSTVEKTISNNLQTGANKF